MRALIYSVQGDTKLDSLQRVMKNIILRDTDIGLQVVTAETLQQELQDDVCLLILPGARASTSYREQLTGPRFESIMRHMDRGMQVLGICAGGYILTKEFEYRDYDPATGNLNEIRRVSSPLGIVNARAFGPDLRLYTPRVREEGNPWSVYTITDVDFMRAGTKRTAALALSKAPSFIDLHPAQCRSLATYAATHDAAMLRFSFGHGGGVLCGPVLEVGGANIENYIHPRHAFDPISQQVVRRLNDTRTEWSELMAQTMAILLPNEVAIQAQIRRNLGVSAEPRPSMRGNSPSIG